MAEQTGIAWTDHTFNPWIGCQKVSPGCDHCYAEALDRRWGGGHWGPHAERRRTSEANWKQPLRWNAADAKARVRRRVFCASLADVFDNAVPAEWRGDLWTLIRACPSLAWQLLTKRPQNIAKMLPEGWGDGWPNVWLGTTCENQDEANRRIPHLLRVPAAVRFLSCEPLIGPVDLRSIPCGDRLTVDALTGFHTGSAGPGRIEDVLRDLPALPKRTSRVDWVIVGGESGNGARPMQLAWAESLRDQCGITAACFIKQIGSNRGPDWPDTITGKGDDPAQWPTELRVQEFPAMREAAAELGT